LRADEKVLTGWGRSTHSRARVARPGSVDEVRAALGTANGRGSVARGLGRSYGDAAQNAGGLVLSTGRLDAVRQIDLESGTVTAEAGLSLDALMRLLVPLGWFVPVTPGTRFVTIGGAIAADIHGKNHHRDGGFGRYVTSFELLLPSGEQVAVDSGDELFAATVGGMGLTGLILAATFRIVPIESGWMTVDVEQAHDLDDALDRMRRDDHRYQYSVAWIDCLPRRSGLGRAVLTRGAHASAEVASDRPSPNAPGGLSRPALRAPRWTPPGLLNQATVRAFNELWFRKPSSRPGTIVQPLGAFFHPLDSIRGWNRLYGPGGFVQHQSVVPFGAEDVLRAMLERIARSREPAFLGVLKQLGRGDGMLSFPIEGWTLALDFPAGSAGLPALLHGLDELVAGAGGRVYFAKDAVLRADMVTAMYPRIDEWRAVRDRVDPDRRLQSDLARRLSL
jgi:decaprenylphospho-beta-D-ribofuranose 2-oxidase